jgi:hypothetical protein
VLALCVKFPFRIILFGNRGTRSVYGASPCVTVA